jgi:hypothetical protein
MERGIKNTRTGYSGSGGKSNLIWKPFTRSVGFGGVGGFYAVFCSDSLKNMADLRERTTD